MATAKEIVQTAMRLIQVKANNEPLSASESADGLLALNDLIDSWTNEQLMQTSRLQRSKVLTAGKKTYTIGVGGDINVARPVSIENAFSRDSNGNDWQIEEINDDQYSRIITKSFGTTYPRFFYYRPLFPLGEITFYPVPSENLTLFINVRANLNLYSDINQNIDWANGYVRALKYNLAVEISPEYRSDVPPLVLEHAKTSKERISDVNNVNIPELRSPLRNLNYDNGFFGGNGGGDEPIPPIDEDDIIETGDAPDTITESGAFVDTITEGA